MHGNVKLMYVYPDIEVLGRPVSQQFPTRGHCQPFADRQRRFPDAAGGNRHRHLFADQVKPIDPRRARVVRHARAITFQLAEVAVTGLMVCAILTTIRRLRAPPICD